MHATAKGDVGVALSFSIYFFKNQRNYVKRSVAGSEKWGNIFEWGLRASDSLLLERGSKVKSEDPKRFAHSHL